MSTLSGVEVPEVPAQAAAAAALIAALRGTGTSGLQQDLRDAETQGLGVLGGIRMHLIDRRRGPMPQPHLQDCKKLCYGFLHGQFLQRRTLSHALRFDGMPERAFRARAVPPTG